ncbi:MAG: mRNA interferase RelE/StbE [Archaeoglobi archaeon]|nr:mRNA interferase RelE/StbE [Archaeoglobi archaeon]MDK2782015.1 mRNA interferase RelE/StbE [Archaeoglobi archaeon]
MGKFSVVVDKDIFKKAKKLLPKANFSKFLDLIKILEDNPVPVEKFDIEKVKGVDDIYRARIGKFRVFYVVFWNERAIAIYKLEKREGAYKK